MLFLLLLLGTLATACGPRVTATQCKSPEYCEEQTPLCYNSCGHPGALSNCGACCAEMNKRCNNCEYSNFSGCD